jgi:UPF0716 protein FxsA
MVPRLFLGYALAELAVVVALVSTIGLRWTLLALLVAFVLGAALAGSQLKRQLRRLRSGLTTSGGGPSHAGGARTRLPGSAADSALVVLGTVLAVVPGLVSTVAGLLLLLPPTRAVARPALTAMAVRGFGRRAPLITVTTVGADRFASTRRPPPDYVDGEVIDATDVDSRAQPLRPGAPE